MHTTEMEATSGREEVSFVVPESLHGIRLDKALGILFENTVQPGDEESHLQVLAGLGIRARRRLCERKLVLVGGRPGTPGLKLRAGQKIVVLPDPDGTVVCNMASELVSGCSGKRIHGEYPFVVHQENGLAALFKPSGMHSAALAGSDALSLETFLPVLLPCCHDEAFPRLLNRLDGATSGLVLAALNGDGARFWRRAERAGRIDKRYLAVVEGQPLYDFTVRRRLNTDGRIRTRVLHTDDFDANRHTSVSLLAALTPASAPELFPDLQSSLPLMLVGCRIRRGARHQIRAHLAAAGHPLLGDTLYGSDISFEKGFLLHHGLVTLAEFSASCLPPWLSLLPEAAIRAGRDWLYSDGSGDSVPSPLRR